MLKYPSIKNLYKLDPETDYTRYDATQYARPEFGMLGSILWGMTEKIDGMNLRIIREADEDYPGSGIIKHRLKFKARTDKGRIPVFMEDRLAELFTLEKFAGAFDHDSPVCLYGEGYGAGIGKGGKYIADGVDFALFDVKVGDLWLQREDVADIAAKMNLTLAPYLGHTTLSMARVLVSRGFSTALPFASTDCMAEGVVLRPVVELFDRRGHRIIAKLKTEYFGKK